MTRNRKLRLLATVLIIGQVLMLSPLAAMPISVMQSTISHGGVVDLGENYQFQSLDVRVELKNDTSEPVVLSGIQAVNKYDKVIAYPKRLAPGETSQVRLVVWTWLDLGVHLHGFKIESVGSKDDAAIIQVKNFGLSVLDQEHPGVDFGVLQQGKIVPGKVVELYSGEVKGFRLTGVESTPTFAKAEIMENGRGLQITANPGKKWGPKSGYVKVGLNAPQQPEAWVRVDIDVQGEVVPDFPSVQMGLVRKGTDNKFLIPLRGKNDKEFKIGELVVNGFRGEVSHERCVPAALGCKLIVLRVSDNQGTGKLNGSVVVTFPEFEAALRIPVSGLVISQDSKVIDLDKPGAERESAGISKVPGAPVDISNVLKKVTAQPILPPADPPGQGPVLRWSVGNEQPLYGYLIYRSEHRDGPFLRVNGKVIPVLGHDDSTSQYAWRDPSAVKGKTYWYFIKTLANNGTKKKLTAPHKVVAH